MERNKRQDCLLKKHNPDKMREKRSYIQSKMEKSKMSGGMPNASLVWSLILLSAYETHLTKDVCEHFNIDRKYFYRIFHYLEIPLRTISENTKMQMELCDHTELSKKISERNKGKVVSEETKRKQSESNKGKKRSE